MSYHYYTGIIFTAYTYGVGNAIVKGGRYDNLMRRLGKKSGAIGFALYLDQLSRLMRSGEEYDADILLLYDDRSDLSVLAKTVTALTKDGHRICVQRNDSGSIKYKTLMMINGTEVSTVE